MDGMKPRAKIAGCMPKAYTRFYNLQQYTFVWLIIFFLCQNLPSATVSLCYNFRTIYAFRVSLLLILHFANSNEHSEAALR